MNTETPKPHRRDLTRSRSFSCIPEGAIAFDLDETLVFATQLKPQIGDCFPVRVGRRRFYVQMRPGLMEFLDQVQKLFDVFFFTASQADYANQVIDRIAPQVRPCRRFYRDACQCQSGFLVKDLRLLRRPLGRVVLVDDLAGSALVNPENLIRVNPWNGKRMDNLLLSRLLPILQNIAHERELAKSAREVISKRPCGDIAMFPGVCG